MPSTLPSSPESPTPSISASTATLAGTLTAAGTGTHTPNERSHLLKFTDSPSADDTEQVDGNEEAGEGVEVDIYTPGKATFNQTLLNCLGDLIGTGLLACPIAIAHAGWVLGPLFLCAICAITLWTLKILIRIIALDRRMRNFADVARYGLGPRAERLVSTIFVGDCSIWLIALIVLSADSFEAVWPMFTSNQWKGITMLIVIPLNFVPLRYLSWTSGIGVASTWTLVAILIFTGIVTPQAPGSIRDPSPTDLWPPHGLIKLGISFGLIISGFGGHFLIPNLIRDMKHPEQADRVVEIAYGICIVVYTAVSVCGYLMFGRDVSDEVSRDLARTAAFSPTMAKIAVAMVAINPLTKLPLGMRPLCDIVYSWFHLHPTMFIALKGSHGYTDPPITRNSSSSSLSTVDTIPHEKSSAERAHDRREKLKGFIRPLISIILLAAFVGGALVLPSFETIMSLLGGGLAMVSCVLLPIAAGANLWGWNWYYKLAFAGGIVVGVSGVVCAILNQ